MKESYPTRREASAEIYEQSDKYIALQTLIDAGILKKVSDLELYHGRAGDGKPWHVEASFNNSGNATGNRNINQKPALNTSYQNVAVDFANARARKKGGQAEVHRIVSGDPDATIVDLSAHVSFEDNERAVQMMRATLPGNPLRWAPLSFKDRHALDNVKPKDLINPEHGVMYDDDIEGIAKKTGLSEELVLKIGSAINTKALLQDPTLIRKLTELYGDDVDTVRTTDIKGIPHYMHFSHEFMANWFRSNHIIGYKQSVNSATLGGRTIDNYILFDLENVNTERTAEQIKRNRDRLFGQIALATTEIGERLSYSSIGNLNDMLVNPYSKPADIVEAAKKTPGYEELFEADAGNWEKYSVAEHTETTLTVFEKNYADILPASVLPIMRTALLVHDIGKGEAAANHEKGRQEEYNYIFARRFMRLNGIDNDTAKFIAAMNGEAKKLVGRATIDGDKGAHAKAISYCKGMLKDYLGDEYTTDNNIEGLYVLIQILQTCDSAAYGTMSTTRSSRNIYYRNSGAFDDSFEEYHGLTGNRARFKPRR